MRLQSLLLIHSIANNVTLSCNQKLKNAMRILSLLSTQIFHLKLNLLLLFFPKNFENNVYLLIL